MRYFPILYNPLTRCLFLARIGRLGIRGEKLTRPFRDARPYLAHDCSLYRGYDTEVCALSLVRPFSVGPCQTQSSDDSHIKQITIGEQCSCTHCPPPLSTVHPRTFPSKNETWGIGVDCRGVDSQVPLEGFKALQGISGPQRFQIHRAYGAPQRLVSAHTCFNQLDLPEYTSKEQLHERLTLAIHEGNEGFGFG